MKRSRRQVLKLLAAGSAASLAGPVAALAQTVAKRRARPMKPAPVAAAAGTPSGAIHAEVEKQKRDLAGLLKTLRDYPLPPGSEQAFAFRPLRAARTRPGRP
jgi:hypothetical protein